MMEHIFIGKINIIAGWMTMIVGILSGSTLGLWAFDGPLSAPKGHKNYSDLSRRLVRLAHIAFFALPIICILYGHHIDLIPLSTEIKYIGSISMIICMIGVPTLLIFASFYLPFKYLEIIPVSAGIIALAIMCYGFYLLL